MMRARSVALAATLFILLIRASGVAALGGPDGSALDWDREGEVETGRGTLDGLVISTLIVDSIEAHRSALWLLVRPVRKPEGVRSLYRLAMDGEPRLEQIAADLAGWIETIAVADLGAGREIVAAGSAGSGDAGRLAALGVALDEEESSSAPFAIVPRPLLVVPGFDLWTSGADFLQRGTHRFFHTVEPGQLNLWEPDGKGGLVAQAPRRIPFSAFRTASGIRLSSREVRPFTRSGESTAGLSRHLFIGPEALGATRVRGFEVDLDRATEPEELWSSLPGPESIAQSWPVEIDGQPFLVVRTQAAGELNIFERQRLRVLPLRADRTRAGSVPTLAVELDSKRWHDTAIVLGDVDGDGMDDLVAAVPEGLSGTDLVVQWWRGKGGGQFEGTAARSDIQEGGRSWILLPSMPRSEASAGAAPPALLTLQKGRLELHQFSDRGRKALLAKPELSATIFAASAGRGERRRQMTVGTNEATLEELDPATAEILGAAQLDGRPGVELLALLRGTDGRDRLVVVRRR